MPDAYLGCVHFSYPTQGFYKEPYQNKGISKYIKFFSSSDCSGAAWYGTDFGLLGALSYQGFNGRRGYSAMVHPLDAFKIQEEAFPVPVFKGSNSLISLERLSRDKAIASRQLGARATAITNDDSILARTLSGIWGEWRYNSYNNGKDLNAPALPPDNGLSIDWATEVARLWAAGQLSGSFGRTIGWDARLYGSHTTADITAQVLRMALWRAINWGGSQGSSWVAFTIVNWNGQDSIAHFVFYTKQGD